MASFYDDNDDLRWYIERGIDWEPIVRLTEYDFKAEGGFATTEEAVGFYRDVLGVVGSFVADEVAPHWKGLDGCHPKVEGGEVVYDALWDGIFEQIKGLELHGLAIPRELGGLNAPLVVLQMVNELFARADVSVCAHNGFHGGMAMAALTYSLLEGSTTWSSNPPAIASTRFEEMIREIVSGEAWGSMDITEPDAGSDMGALRTRGTLAANGQWRVTGPKLFITSGHGKWHFVIARTEEPKGDDAFAGLAGLSMFLVPAWSEGANGERVRHAVITGVEEKLGHNGSATVALQFDDAPAQLIGERGEGFKYMLLLMNGARVGVGFESLGLSESAFRMARAYAAERRSMGKTIDRHEMIADYLDEMRTDIQAVRAITVAACVHEEISQKSAIRLKYDPPALESERAALEKQRKRHAAKARGLTPLLKYAASENAVKHARWNIQIHGGSGYITEYGAEKLLRDAMVFPIYEGTSQIQALMAMKDNLLGAVKNPTRFLKELAAARLRSVSARDSLERGVARLQLSRAQAIQFLLTRLAASKVGELRGVSPTHWAEVLRKVDPKRDFALAMLHAERLCRILIDAATAEVLWEQAARFPERRELLERWLERAEPRSRFALDEIQSTGARLLATLEAPPAAAQAAK